jgi:hypothetical protein
MGVGDGSVHATLVRHPRGISAVAASLTRPGIGPSIASTWAIYWNDLTDGSVPTPAVAAARAIDRVGRAATIGSSVRRALRRDLS